MSYIDKNKLLSNITTDDFVTIIKSLGNYKCRKSKKGIVTTSTYLCHGGDSANKLYYYENGNEVNKNGLCVCMTCGDRFDLVQLIIRYYRVQNKQITWHKALQLIASTLGRIDEVSIEAPQKIKKIDDFSWINRIKRATNKDNEISETKEINENILDLFTYIPHEEWLNDGCSTEALDRYEISYYPSQDMIIIPHRNIDGRLIGIRGRNLNPQAVEQYGKYLPCCIENIWYSHNLSKYLFSLWITKDYIKTIKKICIVEAEKSCIQAYTMFGDRSYVVATCGSNISQVQIDIIKSLNVSKVIYAPDRDYHDSQSFEAEAWYNKQILKLEPFLLYCQVYLIADVQDRLEYKDSPTDKGRDVFLELYEEKIEITMEDVARVKESRGENR